MTNEIKYHIQTLNDIPVQKVVGHALNADLEDVIILGIERDGKDYFAASSGDAGKNIILLEKLKKLILETMVTRK